MHLSDQIRANAQAITEKGAAALKLSDLTLDSTQPILIAGPTASGKSSLALEIAEAQGGIIINADAIQVFDNWRVLTARPSAEDESRAVHKLYGHVAGDHEYSVGHWLRDLTPLLTGPERPIIVGGTGLYFTALTKGLADIPATPANIRQTANERIAKEGHTALLAELDDETLERIDQLNPMRVQRAWEVQTSTGRGIAAWQDDTPAPLLPLTECQPILFDVDRDWLNNRIETRFSQMIEMGALEEAKENLASWHPDLPSAKAIGAPELIGHLKGELTLQEAKLLATISTRQFAKRQRTWFRSKMGQWQPFRPDSE